jgi:uncharacterized membrane protein
MTIHLAEAEERRRTARASERVRSLDILRGVVMVLMAIDHVRVYSGVPAGGPTAGVFFTRWVTHFCAPVFVFLAGTAAFLQLRKTGDRAALAKYLLTRGLMLVVLEMTVIRLSWTFNLNYGAFNLAGVIWMLGWCMVLMAALVWLPLWAIGTVGALLVVSQGLFGLVTQVVPLNGWLWQFLYTGEDVRLGAGGPTITILYVIVPWIGVMALGYAFGAIVVREPERRQRTMLRLGLAATSLFLIGAAALSTQSGEPTPWFVRLLNQRKYPASPLFLLMTLGPSLVLLPFAERLGTWGPPSGGPVRKSLAAFFETFGRVPLFYYLLHIPLIHATALLVWYLRDGVVNAQRFATAPYVNIPEPDRWSLPLLYLVFAAVIAMLYFPCRWYADFKRRHPQSLARYI